jgi:predicted dehydrogenase
MNDSIFTPRRAFLRGAVAAGLAPALSAQAKKPLKIALIGAGGRGTGHATWISKIAEAENVQLAAVCDIYQPRLERAETRFKAKGFSKTADLMKDKSIDAVVIATPDRHHVYNVLEAIRAGKDVYVEKPLCHWAQFTQLKALVHENRKLERVVQVGTQFVSDSVWERAGEKLKAGAIGKVVHAQTSYFRRGDQGEAGMKIDDPNAKPGVGVDWRAAQADAPKREFTVQRLFQWRLFMDYSGGPLTDTYPHTLTPLLKMLNPGMPKKVVAVGGRYYFAGQRDVPDTFDLLIQYPQDLTVAFLGTFVNEVPIDTIVRGSEGSMVKRLDGIYMVPPRGVKKPEEKIASDMPSEREGHTDLTLAHLRDFFNCVRSRQQPRGNLGLAYTVHVPLLMAMQSHLANKAALFDPDKEVIRMA